MLSFVKYPWIVALFCVTSSVWPGIGSAQGQTRAAVADNAPKEIQEMQAVEDRWSDSVTKRDQYGLELVLAPQFIGISSTGDVTTRDQQIARLFVRDAEPVSIEQKVISARFIGDVAIVNGTYVKHWKLDKGTMDEKGIYSHVFEHGRAGWLCLNSQQTVVAEKTPPSAAAGKTKSKSSNAALPFHIPLIYKGPSSTQPTPAPGANEPPS